MLLGSLHPDCLRKYSDCGTVFLVFLYFQVGSVLERYIPWPLRVKPAVVLIDLVGGGFLGAMVTAKVGSTPAVLYQLDLILQPMYTSFVYLA